MSDNSNLQSYLFTVELDGIETARFQKCEGLEAETQVLEIEEGGGGVHHFTGRTRYPNLILEKGISDNNELFSWYKNYLVAEKVERKSGAIVLKDSEGNEVKRWNFFRAMPCRWIGPKLDCSCSSTFALERIEIAHEGLEVDNDTAPVESYETTGPGTIEIETQPRYFNQRDFSESFGNNFGNNACAATSLLNEVSEQYTRNTGLQMTDAQAEQAMTAAVESGSVSANNANVNNWERAANDMWSTTGENGSFSYGGDNPTSTIYAEDANSDGVPEHFTNSNGDGTYHDPWNGETGTVGDTHLQESGLGPTRTLTYSPDGE